MTVRDEAMTKRDEPPATVAGPATGGLSLAQQSAVDLLAAGKNDTETAALLKVNRCTVTRWRLYSPVFQAALAIRRAEVWGSGAARLRALIPKAIDALAEALEQGTPTERAELALNLLKFAGPLPSPGVGSFEPDDYVLEIVKRERAALRSPMDELIESTNGLPAFSTHVEEVKRRLATLAGNSEPDASDAPLDF